MNAPSCEPVLIFGTGGHARVVADIIELLDQFEIAGFIDDALSAGQTSEFLGYKVHGSRGCLRDLKHAGFTKIIVAIGSCKTRMQIVNSLLETGWDLPVLIHPQSIVAASAKIGVATVVCAGAIVGAAAELAAGCILNTACSVDHDCKLANGVHICPGTHLAGDVAIGKESWVGIGSCIIEQTIVGDSVLIGAGSVVTKNLPTGCKAWGAPAKIQT